MTNDGSYNDIVALTAWVQPSPARILIVDDNPSIHRDFDLVLKDELFNRDLEEQEQLLYDQKTALPVAKPVYEIEHALSGLDGVERVKQAFVGTRPYQVAFVDIRMPGIDGVETIERLWKVDPRVQVVICTAFADYSWDDLARRLGPADKLLVLKKPFDGIEVTQLASTLTRKWFMERQADLKMEEMELLVARRTEKLLKLQEPAGSADTPASAPPGAFHLAPPDRESDGEEIAECTVPNAADGAARHADAAFLRRALDTIEKHLSDYEFDVDALARTLAVSRRQLFRRIKAVTGGTPHTLVRTLRLNRAAQLLKTSRMTITEITYAVGFSDLKHFRELFRERFGVLPGDYAEKKDV